MPTLSTNSASSGAYTYTSATPTVATIDPSTGAITLVSAGTTTFTVAQAQSGTYLARSQTTSALTVTVAASVTTSFGLSSTSVAFGATAPRITAPGTSSAGLIRYTSATPTVATIDPSTGVISIIGVGSTDLTATQAATGNYAQGIYTITLTVTMSPGQIQTQLATGGSIGSGTGWSLSGGGSLIWSKVTASDHWSVASSTCTALGDGWHMPTQGQLSGLFNTSTARSAASAAGWTFGYTWSSEPDTAGPHYGVSLSGGSIDLIDNASNIYVSCVH